MPMRQYAVALACYTFVMTAKTKAENKIIRMENIMKNLALFYGMELADKNVLPVADDRIATLGKLHEALLHAWSRETAFPACREDWSMSNPAFGQCTITAMLVHDLFGGTIHRVRLAGGGTHYFNKIDGMYVDLTSSQFADYANECPLEPNEERERPVCGRSTDTWNRYRLLIDNINAWLLSESNDGRITPLMPCGSAPQLYRSSRRIYEEAAGGYVSQINRKDYKSQHENGNVPKTCRASERYAKYGKNSNFSKGSIKIRQAMGVCPECGGALVKRSGKYGDFLGCSHYPECHFTVPLNKAEFETPKQTAGDKEKNSVQNADNKNNAAENKRPEYAEICAENNGLKISAGQDKPEKAKTAKRNAAKQSAK